MLEINEITEGQPVAFYLNSLWTVPATITSIYSDGTVDLDVAIISYAQTKKMEGTGSNRYLKTTLEYLASQTRNFTNVRQCDPRAIYQRMEVPLATVQGGNGMSQSLTDKWVELEQKQRQPQFVGVATSMIGRWFDPSPWKYQLRCFVPKYTYRKGLSGEQDYEQVLRIFPSEIDHYMTFAEVFDRWFKESFEGETLAQLGYPHPGAMTKDGDSLIMEWQQINILSTDSDTSSKSNKNDKVSKGASQRVKINPATAGKAGGRKARTRSQL